MSSRLTTIGNHVAPTSPSERHTVKDIPEQYRHGGTLVALAIRALGVGHIFTLTGGHISPILVGCNAVGIKVVDTRDEKAAVFAADAYARLTGNIGVCAVTAGPGLTNAVTAIVNARMAEVPIMVLAGATSMILKGRGSLQDIDQGALVKSAVKSQTTVKSVKEIIPAVLRASEVAGSYSPAPGPVFLEFPLDVLWPRSMTENMLTSGGYLSQARGLTASLQRWYLNNYIDSIFGRYFEGCSPEVVLPPRSSHELVQAARPVPSRSAVEATVKMLNAAKRPVILVGSQAAQDVAHIEQLREALIFLEVPVWVSGMCRGLFGRSGNSPQMLHMRGKALKDADLVIIAGAPLDFRLNYGRSIGKGAALVVCNSNRDLLRKNRDMRTAKLYVHGCPSRFLREVALMVTRQSRKPFWTKWTATCHQREATREKEIASSSGLVQMCMGSYHLTLDDSPSGQGDRVHPVRLLKAVDTFLQRCGTEAVIVADGGDFVGTASYCVKPVRALGWLDPGVFGTLGVGGGFAVAAGVLAGESAVEPVWILWGDGSVAWSLAEFETMKRHKIPCVAIVGNDGKWNQMYRDQVRLLKDPIATVLGAHVDYHVAAEGYGGNVGFLLEKESDIEDVLSMARTAALQCRGPVLINAMLSSSDFREGSISL